MSMREKLAAQTAHARAKAALDSNLAQQCRTEKGAEPDFRDVALAAILDIPGLLEKAAKAGNDEVMVFSWPCSQSDMPRFSPDVITAQGLVMGHLSVFYGNLDLGLGIKSAGFHQENNSPNTLHYWGLFVTWRD